MPLVRHANAAKVELGSQMCRSHRRILGAGGSVRSHSRGGGEDYSTSSCCGTHARLHRLTAAHGSRFSVEFRRGYRRAAGTGGVEGGSEVPAASAARYVPAMWIHYAASRSMSP